MILQKRGEHRAGSLESGEKRNGPLGNTVERELEKGRSQGNQGRRLSFSIYMKRVTSPLF
jgi:hypothetical protein